MNLIKNRNRPNLYYINKNHKIQECCVISNKPYCIDQIINNVFIDTKN